MLRKQSKCLRLIGNGRHCALSWNSDREALSFETSKEKQFIVNDGSTERPACVEACEPSA